MNYTFVKLKDNRTGLEYPWIMKCTNFVELMLHTEQYMGNEIGKGVQDWFNVNKEAVTMESGYRYVPHLSTNWASAVCTIGNIKGGMTFLNQSIELENEVLNGKRDMLNRYGCIYLRSNGSYMVHGEGFETIEELKMNKMVYPEYGESDIRIVQWDGGTHFYAKLGNMDVVDNDGNQKWDSHDEAYKEALNYLQE